MKHIFFILVIIGIIATGLFLPYLHGDYDYFAVGLSSMTQFASFVSLLLVPIGLIWGLMDLFRDRNSDEPVTYPTLFRKLALAATVIIILFAALGAFAAHNRFSAIIILAAGPFIVRGIYKNGKHLKTENTRPYNITPYYFILIPLAVFSIRIALLERAKDRSTDFVIKQSEGLIQDIESYKKTNGHYPLSIL